MLPTISQTPIAIVGNTHGTRIERVASSFKIILRGSYSVHTNKRGHLPFPFILQVYPGPISLTEHFHFFTSHNLLLIPAVVSSPRVFPACQAPSPFRPFRLAYVFSTSILIFLLPGRKCLRHSNHFAARHGKQTPQRLHIDSSV